MRGSSGGGVLSECQWRWLGEVVLRDPSVRCLLLLSTLPFLLRQPPQQQQAAGVGVEDWAGWDDGRSLRRLLRGLEAWKVEGGQGREAVLLAAGGSQAVVTQVTLLPPHKGPDEEEAALPPPLCTQILCPSLSASGVGGGPPPPVVVLAGSEGRLDGPGLSLAYKHIQVGEGGQSTTSMA